VTIAAGFRFNHGALLCADTEITHGTEQKTTGSKIIPVHFATNGGSKAIFTFAGPVHYAKMAIQQCQHALATAPTERMGRSGMLDIISEELQKFHIKHIYKHPYYQMTGGPDFNLILGLLSPHEGSGLYETSDEAVIEITTVDRYACIGGGGVLARYVVSWLLIHPFLKLGDITSIATHMLREVKNWVPGCGKSSELIVLNDDGDMSNVAGMDISHIDPVADAFSSFFWGLFLETCDLSSPETAITNRLDMFRTTIAAMRRNLQAQDREQPEIRKVIKILSERNTRTF
jgi:20S proteasome alpha/beta subunit